MPGVALEAGDLGRVGSRATRPPDEALDRGLAGRRLAERRQHLGDVAEEQRVRTDDEHALACRAARGARRAGRRRGGARPRSCRCPDRPARPGRCRCGARITTSCSAAIVATMSRISPVRERSSSASSGSGMPPWWAASTLSGSSNTSSKRSSTWRAVIRKRRRRLQLHRVGGGGPVEGRGHGRPPVDDHGIARARPPRGAARRTRCRRPRRRGGRR